MYAIAPRMDQETLEAIRHAFGRRIIAHDARQALLEPNGGMVDQRRMRWLIARKDNPVEVGLRTPGDTVVLRSGDRYQVTEIGAWRLVDA